MLDLNTASAFATIVGLICSFRQEQNSSNSLTASHFIQWLAEHKHEIIKAQLEGNQKFLDSLLPLLQIDNNEIIEKIDVVNQRLAQVLSHIDSFSAVAHSLMPNNSLSEDAFKILGYLVDTQEKLLQTEDLSGTFFQIGQDFIEGDIQFLQDDIKALSDLGFLILQNVSNNGLNRTYRLTRAGKDYYLDAIKGGKVLPNL
jgi:hypothetical protein